MVITCQTVEFGRATTVLGITMMCNFLQEKQGVDDASLNREIHYSAIIGNEILPDAASFSSTCVMGSADV
jgi:hypothetical protein